MQCGMCKCVLSEVNPSLLLLDEDAKSQQIAKQRQLQAEWQTKCKPMAVEGHETTENLEMGEREGAVAEGG